jgi:hypothetical protein
MHLTEIKCDTAMRARMTTLFFTVAFTRLAGRLRYTHAAPAKHMQVVSGFQRTSERNCSLKNDGQSRSTFPVWTYRGRDSTGRDYELPRSKLAEQCLQGSLCATATNSFVSLLKSLSDDALSSNDRPVC